VILPQVTFGIAVRMAVMAMLAGTERMKIHIKNGRLIDPASKIDKPLDVFIAPGAWSASAMRRRASSRQQRARRHRLHRLPRPGRSLGTAARAGLRISGHPGIRNGRRGAGGVTSLACPPDTDPVLDEPGLVEMLKHRARLPEFAHVIRSAR
jgi:dihydroorotase